MARLSAKLSSRAKQSMLRAQGEVSVLVEVAPTPASADLEQKLAGAGVTASHWTSQPRFLHVTIPANRLSALADLEEVVYVDMGTMSVP